MFAACWTYFPLVHVCLFYNYILTGCYTGFLPAGEGTVEDGIRATGMEVVRFKRLAGGGGM
jgi:hypothetical protein